MRSPLPTGTILQNRYRILSILGQGGFGRTYLAEDQGRFNELCALKELTPAQGGEYALQKSQELFQREAQILYQIQHPQIPQFRATFEQDQRLFLVQDYVEGPTYRRLLDQRKAHSYAFSEAEVLQLLRQLLPVMAHIHSKGIVHRDIAPDNIILREKDNKPVLIDFGVVKELATRFQSPEGALQNTTVGKPGYAPSEQMHTGRAYPCSDLYSLAVTAVVLLTGHEPQELFDDRTLTWYWQRWVTVDPRLAEVLNKMLSYRPGDRYQSVVEVVQALDAPAAPPPPVAPLPPSPPGSPTSPPVANVSQAQTLAVGRRPDAAVPVAPARNQSEPSIEAPRGSVWDEPWAVAMIGLALVALTGIGSYWVVQAVLRNQPTPLPTETATVSPSPSPTDTETPSPSPSPTEPVVYSQRLDITPDTPITRRGNLKANETVNYIVPGEQGQLLSASLKGEGVLMTVLAPNQEPLDDRAQRVSYWQGTLPYTGNFSIQLSPVKGLEKGDYQLEVSLKNPPEPSPSPTESPTPTPPVKTIETIRLDFPPGGKETTITSQSDSRRIKRYLVYAETGSVLSARVSPGNEFLTLDIRYPDGNPVEDASGVLEWEAKINSSGEYQIDVIATEEVNFQLDITVRGG
jgi:serine/threonine-protein kinase